MPDLPKPIEIFSTEEDNDDYDLTELERDELLRRCREMCDIIGGEDAYDRFEHDELMDMLKDLSTSAQEWNDLQEIKDAQDAHELFNPVPEYMI